MTLQEIMREARALSTAERRELIKALVDTLDVPVQSERQHYQHSLMELAGLGAEIWQGIDAQKYVDELRNEWDKRP